MAVAVKTPPGNRPSEAPSSPAVLSLLGVVYLIACLALLFKIVPDLWWTVWEGIGLSGYTFIGGTFLLAISLLLAFTLLGLGSRLLGPHPPEGVKAGVFVGLVGLLTVLLLTRWVSIPIERAAYEGSFSPTTGMVLTGVFGGLLLLGLIRLFTTKWAHNALVQLEHGGWFSAVAYKPNQGQRVRRATIFGILLLVGAGIYTMLIHNTLRRGAPDLAINIPFTGGVALDMVGDAQGLIAGLPSSAMTTVQVRYPGARELRLRPGQAISLELYKAKLRDAMVSANYLEEPRGHIKSLEEKGPVDYIHGVNEFLYEEIKAVWEARAADGSRVLRRDVVTRLEAIDHESDVYDLRRVIEATKREVELAKRVPDASEVMGVFNLPHAALIVDRFALRDVYSQVLPDQFVRIEEAGNSKFEVGQIVSRKAFDDEVERVEKEVAGGLPPIAKPPYQPGGPTAYATLTLLPSIQFTVPLLLILGSLWLAWRAVNMPAFADFLIATEAEMNKVSWTTQKKLVQDTIVVLITVLLMAIFLFVVDYAWKVVLQPLGVLHIPKEPVEKTLRVEQKKW